MDEDAAEGGQAAPDQRGEGAPAVSVVVALGVRVLLVVRGGTAQDQIDQLVADRIGAQAVAVTTLPPRSAFLDMTVSWIDIRYSLTIAARTARARRDYVPDKSGAKVVVRVL